MPPEGAAALPPLLIEAGTRALGLSLTPVQLDQLARYSELLPRWNAVHNLTALSSPDEILTHHLLDSLAILRPLATIFGDRAVTALDIGSGGGLPGIPIAVAMPAWRLSLLDKVRKKVAFLTQVKVELGLKNVECVHARAEQLEAGPFDLIVSRAFATLADFVGVSRHLLADGGWWAAMKGVRPDAEIEALSAAVPSVRVADVVKLEVPRLGAERHLILLQRT